MRISQALLLTLFCLPVLPAAAQNLTLFEGTETQQEAQTPQPQQTAPQRQPGAPPFTLRGTSRFGDQHNVLLYKGEESIKVEWRENSAVNVPNNASYQVIDVGSRRASVRYPANEQCFEFPDQGVSCSSDGRIAVLTLQDAQSITPLPDPSQEPQLDENVNYLRDEAGELILNPFTGEPQVVPEISEAERQARIDRQQARAERLRNFEPIRIPDNEVPEGMRKVSTPFGDRLIPENE